MIGLRALAAAAMVVAASTSAVTQTVTGTLQGTVADKSGGVLPGVSITVKNVETGAERTLVTNDVGFYSSTFLPIGHYAVTAELSGFGRMTRDGVQVGLNETRVVDLVLDPQLTQSVSVTADAPPINTTNGEVKGRMTAEEIMDKPSANAGSFLSLAETIAGFQENPTSGQNNPTTSSGSSINFNNTGTRGSTFLINGVNNDDSSENQNRQGASLSTIQEFQVLKAGYTAEFGRGDGAVVIVQTKSGTNRYRGDAYLYQQDSDWNARTFFALPNSPKPVRQRSQYGATIGFPVVANKLFAFGSADRTKSDGENGYTRDVFLSSELAAPRLTRGNDTPANRAFIQSVLARFPASLTPNDPRSARTFTGVADFDFPDQDYSIRGDWNATTADTVTARYQYTHQVRDPQDVIIGEQVYQNNRQGNLGVTWTRLFGAKTVGEFRYGLGVRSTNADVKAGNDTPIIRFNQSPVSASIIGNAGTFPINRDQTDHQLVYNLATEVLRNHSLKFGTDIRWQALDDIADNFSRGFWTFNNVCAGVTYSSSWAAFLDGCVATHQKGYGPFFLENRASEANVYALDEWRVRRDLTLALGLRYEYVTELSEAADRIDYGYSDDTNNIEPRLGFAYVPQGQPSWLERITGPAGSYAIRGGWGQFDGRLFQSVFAQSGASIRFNPPNALQRTLSSTASQLLTLSDPTDGFVFTPGSITGRATLTLTDPNLEMPRTTKWNLSFERTLPWHSTITITYQGNHNDKRLKYDLGNLPLSPVNGPITVANHPNNAPSTGFPDLRGKTIDRIAADVNCAGTGFFPGIATTAQCPTAVPLADNEISGRVPRTNERRPDPRYGTNLLVSNAAEAWYDGVEFVWAKRLTHGIQFQASYTFSKSIDTVSEATAVGPGDSNQNGSNSAYARGYSRFHTPHRFTLNGSYRLPFFQGRDDLLGQALGGWQLSAFLKLASGTPFSVTETARDLDFDGFAESRPVIVDRSIVGNSVDHPSRSLQQLPLSAFRATTFTDTFADVVPRNAFSTDGVNNLDLAIAKTFRLPFDNHSVGVRLEAFNALNQVQFGFPSLNLTALNFGALVSTANAYSPRVLQLVVRYRY